MKPPDVVIVASGGANVASLQFAIDRLGVVSQLSSDAGRIAAATHVILPGVGAAADAMARLQSSGLDQVIPQLRQPVLGICLGMQLLFESSEEGNTPCLRIIPGVARRIGNGPGRPVPHMGWNTISIEREGPLTAGLSSGADYGYFVHSYAVDVGAATLATTDYGYAFSACVQWRNFYGAQFHPERSAAAGARLLRNFLELA